MSESDEERARRRAQRLRDEIDKAVRGERSSPPRSPREFVAEQMRRREQEEADEGEEEDEKADGGDAPPEGAS